MTDSTDFLSLVEDTSSRHPRTGVDGQVFDTAFEVGVARMFGLDLLSTNPSVADGRDRVGDLSDRRRRR